MNSIPRIGTRGSPLALYQANAVAALLQTRMGVDSQIVVIKTSGDRLGEAPLSEVGGKRLFVKEIEDALLAGDVDLAVHSSKDMPALLPEGLEIGGVLPREDPRDAFVSTRFPRLRELPAGSRVGTSSLRRESQIRATYPRLEVAPLRGNVQTRLRKLDEGQFDAVILAAAGLKRLGLESRITSLLEPEESLPAVGQGALGIECRVERSDLLRLLSVLDDPKTRWCVEAERALSRALAGNCNVPLGGYAIWEGRHVRLRGFVAAPDGSRSIA